MQKNPRFLSVLLPVLACAVWLCLMMQAALAQVRSQAASEQLMVYPSLIVYNAKIYSMDQNLSQHQAMAVREDRIWKLGTTEEIRSLAGPKTELIDMKGRVVLPGLIDAHTDPQLWGSMHLGHEYDPQLQWLYVEADKPQELKSRFGEALAKRIEQAGRDKWVIASVSTNVGLQAIATKTITDADLDRFAPDTPVLMMTGIVGSMLGNAKARAELKRILGRDVSQSSGTSVRVWETVPFDVILRGKTKEVADLLAKEMEEMVPLGVTAAMTRVESPQVIRSLRYLDQQGKMPLRWAWIDHIGFTLAANPSEFYTLLGDIVGWGTNYFWMSGVGAEGWDDGCPTSAVPRAGKGTSQQATETSPGGDGTHGRCSIYPGSRLYEAHLAAARAGLRLMGIHSMTDISLDAAIRMADEMVREGKMTVDEIRAAKWGFDHGKLIRPDQPAKAAKYGFWMTFQARNILGEETALQNYGPQYISWVCPVRAWAEAGARFTLNTDTHLYLGKSDEEVKQDKLIGNNWADWPKEWRNTIWPWLGVWITREINGKVYSPQNKLDRTTVMKAWTNWSAEYMLREQDLGSLEPGKLADFIAIDRDYFTIPESDINNIKTLMTAIGGQVKFKAPGF